MSSAAWRPTTGRSRAHAGPCRAIVARGATARALRDRGGRASARLSETAPSRARGRHRSARPCGIPRADRRRRRGGPRAHRRGTVRRSHTIETGQRSAAPSGQDRDLHGRQESKARRTGSRADRDAQRRVEPPARSPPRCSWIGARRDGRTSRFDLQRLRRQGWQLFQSGPRILPTEDEDVSAAVAAAFREAGIIVRESFGEDRVVRSGAGRRSNEVRRRMAARESAEADGRGRGGRLDGRRRKS